MKRILIPVFLFPIFCMQSGFAQTDSLLTADSLSSGARFGHAVGVSGNDMIVGAPLNFDGGKIQAGSVFLFKVDSLGSPGVKISPKDTTVGKQFGITVDIDGGFAAIGAWQDNERGDAAGATYVFERNGNNWQQADKLLPDDIKPGDRFGYAVALSGDYLVVGTPHKDEGGFDTGAAYVFRRVGTGWVQISKLVANDPAQDDQFGFSVAISDSGIAIGAPFKDDNGEDSGSVYVFRKIAKNEWQLVEKLKQDEPKANDQFGRAVAISRNGEYIIAGGPSIQTNGPGAAYIFQNNNNAWTPAIKLIADSTATSDQFGWSVDISNDGGFAIAGAPQTNDSSGAVYIFRRREMKWSVGRPLKTSAERSPGDNLGWSVAIEDSGRFAVTSIPGSGNAGAAAFFGLSNNPPKVNMAMPDTVLTVGGLAFETNLNTVFSDPDPFSFNDTLSDTLKYTDPSSSDSSIAIAKVSGDTLAVSLADSPRVGGTATITVAAIDAEDDTTQISFTVFVNYPPEVKPIPDIFLTPGCEDFVVDLDSVFFDPDGDALNYTASSSNANAVGVELQGRKLIVVPAQPEVGDSAIVIINADDGRGGMETTTFTAKINMKPMVNPVEDHNIKLVGPPLEIDLNTVFADADSNNIYYSAISSDTSIAKVDVFADTLIVTPVKGGNVLVTISADDSIGCSTETTFTVNINSPPTVIKLIPETDLRLNCPEVVIELDSVFNDVDGDPLTFAASSADTSIAFVRISETWLILTPTDTTIGRMTTITVLAEDTCKQSVSTSFVVKIRENHPPVVEKEFDDISLSLQCKFIRDLTASPVIFSDPDNDSLIYSASSSDTTVVKATISGDVLTVTLIDSSKNISVVITVTATDICGDSASTSINVTIDNVDNQPPVVSQMILDTILTLGDSLVIDDLDSVFNDPDGDVLNFTASSSNGEIARADVFGQRLVVSLVNPSIGDSAAITVTANDGRGCSVETKFIVTANFPPMVQIKIPDKIVSPNCPETVLILSNIFFDDDGDPLSFSANSSDTTVARPFISGDTLRVVTTNPIAEDTVEIIVVATDGRASSVDSFVVEINMPPVVEGSFQDMRINIISGNKIVSLDTVFSDPDNDMITYIANVLDTAIAKAAVSGDTLIIMPLAPGKTDVIIIASDKIACQGTSTSLSVTIFFNQLPSITHTPVDTALENSAIAIEAQISDDTGIQTIELHYRRGGDDAFTVKPSFPPDSTTNWSYAETIPLESVTTRGVDYRLIAKDIDGDLVVVPNPKFFSVRVRTEGLSAIPPIGDQTTDYRLISAPLDLDRKSPVEVLETHFGAYNREQWRFFGLRPDNIDFRPDYPPESIYLEFPQISSAAMDGGKAFWLLVKDGSKRFNTGPGKSVRTSDAFAIRLNPAWNFVGNPFNFDISINNLTIEDSQAVRLRAYTGFWNDPNNSPVEVLEPFKGYAIFNDASAATTLFIAPYSTATNVPSPEPFVSKRDDENASWSIRIVAEHDNMRDVDNLAMVTSLASDKWDVMDWPEPPPVLENYISVYFPHPEWERPAVNYCTDARHEVENGSIWKFEIKTDKPEKIKLTFENIDQVLGDYEVWLVDNALGLTQNLRTSNHCDVAVFGKNSPKQLQLVVGSGEYINENIAQNDNTPKHYRLAQNFPNPFNPATIIRYSLPVTEKVSLTIYNLLGEEISTLVQNETKTAGHHFVIWDGRSKHGLAIASGIYVYRLQAGSFTQTKKMILVK